MKFTVKREALLKPLNLVAGVVERRQTLPVLSNVLIVLSGDQLSLTGTDLEVEIIGRIQLVNNSDDEGEITVPARKLLEICKNLPDGSDIVFSLDNNKLTVKSGRSRFTLSTLSANEFPSIEEEVGSFSIRLLQKQLKRLIDRTAFAMAQQDVRYYLNGMLWEVSEGLLRVVATDGHRLAMCKLATDIHIDELRQIIVPRKGINELNRLLIEDEKSIDIVFGTNHLRATTEDFTFTSKLVDGKFPDYERVLPKGSNKTVYGSREDLRQAFSRTAILSNEKYRGIRLLLTSGNMQIVANNPEQEEAEETVNVDYQGDSLEIGFNVSYLVDVLSVLSGENIKISLADSNSSALLEEAQDSDSHYVVMPMRL